MSLVYCRGCRHVFPEYRVIGQRIKDAAPHPLAALGTVALNVCLDGPLASMLNLQNWETVFSISELEKIRSGSRRDALNAARFPCPVCREVGRWKRGDSDKGSVIRPGELNWKGGSNRFLLE